MGRSIHYSGQLKESASITALTKELQDICTTLNWSYHLFNDNNFQGICCSPEGCEPVLFTFMTDPNPIPIVPPILHTPAKAGIFLF